MSRNQKKGPVKFNIYNVHYALRKDGTGISETYDAPKALPGAKAITFDPEGDTTTFYADGIKYYVSRANQGYAGSLEIAFLPDEFRKDVLGEEEDSVAHVMAENANTEGKSFALFFQMDKSDGVPVMFVFYACTASRAPVNANTNTASKEPDTDTIQIDAAPLADGLIRAKTTDKTPDSLKNIWYDKVWMPGEPFETGALTVRSFAGTTSGNTVLTVSPPLEDGNKYQVKSGSSTNAPMYMADCSGTDYQEWDGTTEIAAASGDSLLVVECTAEGKAVKSGKVTVVSAE